MITAIAPHTRIDNSIITNMADIGVYCYAVYSAIKMHLNQATGACFPSYATIARITGINRSTVIQCVKKLKALKLLSPQWRFQEDGSHTSNQYDFQAPGKAGASNRPGAGHPAPSKKIDLSTTTQGTKNAVPSKKVADSIPMDGREMSRSSNQDNCDKGSRPEPPPLVAENNHPGCPEPPEQSEGNKKIRTMTEVDFMPTEKQKTCPHPAPAIVHLSDNITICHHCWGLLDEHLQLVVEKKIPDAQAA